VTLLPLLNPDLQHAHELNSERAQVLTSTRLRTSSRWRSASSWAMTLPPEKPMTWAAGTSRARSRPAASSAMVATVNGSSAGQRRTARPTVVEGRQPPAVRQPLQLRLPGLGGITEPGNQQDVGSLPAAFHPESDVAALDHFTHRAASSIAPAPGPSLGGRRPATLERSWRNRGERLASGVQRYLTNQMGHASSDGELPERGFPGTLRTPETPAGAAQTQSNARTPAGSLDIGASIRSAQSRPA
jgi:hypothetical protein